MGNRSANGIKMAVTLALLGSISSMAVSDTVHVDGRMSVEIMSNVEPKKSHCWIEEDCSPGQICRVWVSLSGPAAEILLRELKRVVGVDKGWQEVLEDATVYTSKDGNLTCDGTDEKNQFCSLILNVSKGSLEPVPTCD